MKAKDAVLYFTDPETGKRCQMKFDGMVFDTDYKPVAAMFGNTKIDFDYKKELVVRFKECKFSKVPEVKHVVHSNNVCTVIWDDGVKTQAVCHPEDTYNKDVGLLVAYLKRFMPTEDVINLVEKWSHQQKKQEEVQARKKAEKARKQYREELDAAREEYEKHLEGILKLNILDLDSADVHWGSIDNIDEDSSAYTVKTKTNVEKLCNEGSGESEWRKASLVGFPIKYRIL